MATSYKNCMENRRNEERKRLDDKYGLNVKPSPTSYREVVMLSPPGSVIPLDDPICERIQQLAEKDRLFYQNLQEDKALHEVFWYAMERSQTWKPSSPTEEIMCETINEAIIDRVDYVLAQKVLLGKYFHLLSSKDKTRLHELADDEIMETEDWLETTLPNYSGVRYKLLAIRSLDFSRKTTTQTVPLFPMIFHSPYVRTL